LQKCNHVARFVGSSGQIPCGQPGAKNPGPDVITDPSDAIGTPDGPQTRCSCTWSETLSLRLPCSWAFARRCSACRVPARAATTSLLRPATRGLSAFWVFFTQSLSFSDYQWRMYKEHGRNGASSLFGAHRIPKHPAGRHPLRSDLPGASRTAPHGHATRKRVEFAHRLHES
jgi:hypothetical protein